jgi:hypothetical protein
MIFRSNGMRSADFLRDSTNKCRSGCASGSGNDYFIGFGNTAD